MKQKIFCVVLAALMMLGTFSLASCGSEEVLPEEGTVTRITVDVNPSVELMVDDQNKVISATALNDDGSILIAGEAFVGKTPEEATALVVSLAVETGYLVKGNVEADENTVTISVSGDTRYAKVLAENIGDSANAVLEEFDINGKIAKVEALNTEALRSIALATSLYTEEELAQMDDDQLYAVIAAGRVETALLLTEEMRNAYYAAKEYEISFAESEATANVIKAMGGLYTLTYTAYKTAVDMYARAITELDNFRYAALVDPDSMYQKSLAALREAKVELLTQKNYTASLNINGEEYEIASVTLQMREEDYTRALAAYEAMGEQVNESLETLISTLRTSENRLRELENTLFDENIEAKLQENAAALEAEINAAKDNFFAEFEEAHRDDITKIEGSLIAKKQQLKDSIENGNAK